jgi:hypothetical protein
MSNLTEDQAQDGAGQGTAGLNSPWRHVAGVAVLTSAVSHLLVTEDTWRAAGYLGACFMVFELACAVIAWRLWVSDTARIWLACGAAGTVGIATYGWSRSVGLPSFVDDVGRWSEPLGLVSVTAEVVMAGLAVQALAAGQGRPITDPRAARRSLVAGSVAAQVGITALFAALLLGGPSPATGDAGVLMRLHAGMSASGAMPGAGMAGSGYWNAVAGQPYHPTGVVRTYYLGADEVVWNYAPSGRNQITGKPFAGTEDTYVRTGPGRIGASYLKCLYRPYTDATFTTTRSRPATEAYLGFTGPVIRAAVGDTIKVVFRNACTIPASVHPHGVFYTKASEGAPYADNTTGNDTLDDAVPTGGHHTYTWLVPDRAGPGPGDPSSVMWMYHSHTDEIGDTYAGLQGFMAITARGMARPDGSPKDVDQEIFELFSVMNENNSPYLTTNTQRFAAKPYPAADDEDFIESNLMHSINGYVYGNQPLPALRKGSHVRWYLMSMGTEVDLHTPHWHGNDVLVNGMRMDVVSLLPASMITADMVPDNPGIWLFHCHVNDHLTAGMVTRYQVTGLPGPADEGRIARG